MPILRTILRFGWPMAIVLALPGCDRYSQFRAKSAYADYQSAIASNDMMAARQALTRLVAIQDNVPDNWMELGKLQASMGSFDGAYYSFARANELNRGDPNILRALTEIALRGGNFAAAQKHGKELEVVVPGDPWVKLAAGYASLKESRFEDATKFADSILADSPYDANGVSLKARALLGAGHENEALKLLQAQVKAQPSDAGGLALLAKIHERHGDWPAVAQATEQILRLNPSNRDVATLAIEAHLRSGDPASGRRISLRVLKSDADPSRIAAILDLWSTYWPSPQAIADAEQLARSAVGVPRKLLYSRFLNRAGRPSSAERITAPAATLPVDADSADANAVLADSLALDGKLAEAKKRFDAVILFDSGNAVALRGRAQLYLKLRNPKAAVEDAQKLVSVLPQSARDRILLANCYQASGNGPAAEAALWDGSQAIAADESLHSALKASKHGNADDIRAVDEEFDRQRDAKLNQRIF